MTWSSQLVDLMSGQLLKSQPGGHLVGIGIDWKGVTPFSNQPGHFACRRVQGKLTVETVEFDGNKREGPNQMDEDKDYGD